MGTRKSEGFATMSVRSGRLSVGKALSFGGMKKVASMKGRRTGDEEESVSMTKMATDRAVQLSQNALSTMKEGALSVVKKASMAKENREKETETAKKSIQQKNGKENPWGNAAALGSTSREAVWRCWTFGHGGWNQAA
jgi:hypothetical protein